VQDRLSKVRAHVCCLRPPAARLEVSREVILEVHVHSRDEGCEAPRQAAVVHQPRLGKGESIVPVASTLVELPTSIRSLRTLCKLSPAVVHGV
jgi:hypothetical protein